MITIKCDICKKEIEDYGALLFSPPNEENKVKKFHICRKCFYKLKEKYDLENDSCN